MGLSGHPASTKDKFQVKVRDEEENPKSFSGPHTQTQSEYTEIDR